MAILSRIRHATALIAPLPQRRARNKVVPKSRDSAESARDASRGGSLEHLSSQVRRYGFDVQISPRRAAALSAMAAFSAFSTVVVPGSQRHWRRSFRVEEPLRGPRMQQPL